MIYTDRTVLIVDDESFMLLLIEHALKNLGAQIITAMNGQEALEKAHTHTPHLAIVDYQMPGWNGLETIRQLRLLSPCEHLPAILLTARGQGFIRQEVEKYGINAFFTKPFSPSALLAQVETLLGTREIPAGRSNHEAFGGGGRPEDRLIRDEGTEGS